MRAQDPFVIVEVVARVGGTRELGTCVCVCVRAHVQNGARVCKVCVMVRV